MMARPATSITEKFHQAARRSPPPDLLPINRAAFDRDVSLALEKANNLAAYRRYLEQARAAKAQRRGVSQAFERTVVGQARRALDDMEAFWGAVLRITQQTKQTPMWSQTLDRMVAGLGATGSLSAKQIWEDLQASEGIRTLIRAKGFTDEMATALTEAVAAGDARLTLREGKPAVEVHVPGQSQPRFLPLGRGSSGRPTTVTELLRRPRFDQIVAAFTNREPVYLEVIPSGSEFDYELSDLVAIGAVASRQRMAEHVRKLEDTGLATYVGRDPGTLLIVGFIAFGVALLGKALVLEYCGSDGDSTGCAVGYFLMILGILVLAFAGGALIAAGGAALVGGAFFVLNVAVYYWELYNLPTTALQE